MTRAWHVPPSWMCDQHLLGEHKEIHQAVGSTRAGRSLAGHVERGQLDLASLDARHEELSAEMLRRWPKPAGHASPLPKHEPGPSTPICVVASGAELARRCIACHSRMVDAGAREALALMWEWMRAGADADCRPGELELRLYDEARRKPNESEPEELERFGR